MTTPQPPTTVLAFRKKPVVIEAMRLTHNNKQDVLDWCPAAWQSIASPQALIFISTLEGDMRVTEGDWVIRGVKGEFYPCKPDIFDMTYEPAALNAEAPQQPPTTVRFSLRESEESGLCFIFDAQRERHDQHATGRESWPMITVEGTGDEVRAYAAELVAALNAEADLGKGGAPKIKSPASCGCFCHFGQAEFCACSPDECVVPNAEAVGGSEPQKSNPDRCREIASLERRCIEPLGHGTDHNYSDTPFAPPSPSPRTAANVHDPRLPQWSGEAGPTEPPAEGV